MHLIAAEILSLHRETGKGKRQQYAERSSLRSPKGETAKVMCGSGAGMRAEYGSPGRRAGEGGEATTEHC